MSTSKKESKKDSKSLRVKKNLATKIVKSKAGEMVIKHNLGEEGWASVVAITECIASIKDKKSAKEWRNNVFKFAVKASIMFENKKFTKEEANNLKIPLESASAAFADIAKVFLEKKPKELIIQRVELYKKYNDELCCCILDLIGPHMTEKNRELLRSIIQYLSLDDFMDIMDKEENIPRIQKILDSVMKILEKSNIYKEHKIRLSNSTFSDKYSRVIELAQNAWKKIKTSEKEEHLAIAFLQNFSDKNEKYAEMINKMPHSDDLKMQGQAIANFFNYFITNIHYWEEMDEYFEKNYEELLKWVKEQNFDDLKKDVSLSVGFAFEEILQVKHFEKTKLQLITAMFCDKFQ